MLKINIQRRGGNYFSWLNSDRRTWEVEKTVEAAIGAILITLKHPITTRYTSPLAMGTAVMTNPAKYGMELALQRV